MDEQTVDPTQWRIRIELRHKGVIYGPGEPIPDLTFEEAQRYETAGRLVRVGVDGRPVNGVRGPMLKTASDFLRAKDEVVLRHLVERRPRPAVVQEIEAAARRSGRSPVLQEALRAVLTYAGRRPRGARAVRLG